MKEILRQLLEAERAGRQAAALLEEEAETLLRSARAEGAEAARCVRAATDRRLEELRRESRDEIERERRAILRDGANAAQALRRRASECRAEAVARVVALLLSEDAAERGEG